MSAVAIPAALIAALIQIESAGNDNAVGDRGRALGCLQIRAEVVHDVNTIAGTNLNLRDMYDRRTAVSVCLLYLSHYATRDRLRHEPTVEDMARIWNGGPDGWLKKETRDYWIKVHAMMLVQIPTYAGELESPLHHKTHGSPVPESNAGEPPFHVGSLPVGASRRGRSSALRGSFP